MASSELPPYAQVKSALPILTDVPTDYRRQGIEVPNTRKQGQTGHYRNARFKDFYSVDDNPGFPKTEYEVFNHGLSKSWNKRCLGWRPFNPQTGDFELRYVWQTYAEVDARRTAFGSGLVKLQQDGKVGTDKSTGWSVGLWTHNRPEWQVTNQACAAYSLVSLSLYDTLGPNVVEYCINHAEARVVIASSAHIPALLKLAPKCPTLKVVVSADAWDVVDGVVSKSVSMASQSQVLRRWGIDVGIEVLEFNDVEELGKAHPSPHVPPKPDQLTSLCYTSGTTGPPKGAILNHRTIAAAVVGNCHGEAPEEDDVMISYLPLSHIYERFVEAVAFASGIPVGFHCGDNLRLLEDFQTLKPTRMVSVPRVLNRVYQAVNAQIASTPGLKGKLARKALQSKLDNLRDHQTFTHGLWDRLVFKKVKAALGGNVKYIASGSAPIAPEVLDFLKVAFVTDVIEGYGSTENTGTCTRCLLGDHQANGTVGPPQVGVEVKLVDVPDMNYFSTDKPYPRGEICVRAECCTPGYYKDEEKTKELIDADGWQHSGDIGMIDEKGRIKIIDRVKNLMKLAQGEYVALEKIEGVYALCPLLAQIYVHGDSLESHLLGIVVPNPETFAPFASAVTGKQISPTDVSALSTAVKDPKVIDAMLAEMNKEAKRARLNGYETIRQLHITLEPFSVENDLLTPTFKMKRPVARKYFKEVTDKLYAEFKKSAPQPKL